MNFKQFCLVWVTFFIYNQLNVKTVLFQTIQFNVCTISLSKQVQFQIIQFSTRTHFSSIWSIDKTLSGTTIPGQSGRGNDGNESVLCIPQSFSISGISLSDCSVSYQGIRCGQGSYPSAEVQSVYSTATADCSIIFFTPCNKIASKVSTDSNISTGLKRTNYKSIKTSSNFLVVR